LLLAQRRLYSRAKQWAAFQSLGIGLVAVAAPICTALDPDAAVPVAAVASVWYFLNHVVFRQLERAAATKGATVQEQFDTTIFGMPTIAVRDPRVSPEDIARAAGGRNERQQDYAIQKLRDWYPIQDGATGRVAIAIAQRGNVAYTRRLLAWNAAIWLSVLAAWTVVAFAIALWREFTLAEFLLVLAIPLLPPLVDAWEDFVNVRSAGRERDALAAEIQDAVQADGGVPIKPEQLVAWQSQLFALRRDAPIVPDWLYKLLRKRNEAEMSEAAETLGRTTRQGGDE
jgi:hypothetical protein